MMINPGDNISYPYTYTLFCPYCGKEQPVKTMWGEYKHKPDSGTKPPTVNRKMEEQLPRGVPLDYDSILDEEVIEPYEVRVPTIEVKKKKKPQSVEAKDRMKHKVCEEGWWNPITKKCQGKGQGHNVIDNDE
jgi:hypothetical protein